MILPVRFVAPSPDLEALSPGSLRAVKRPLLPHFQVGREQVSARQDQMEKLQQVRKASSWLVLGVLAPPGKNRKKFFKKLSLAYNFGFHCLISSAELDSQATKIE